MNRGVTWAGSFSLFVATIVTSPSALAATNTSTATSTIISTVAPLKSYEVTYNAKSILQPKGFVKNGTTYMAVSDILQIFKAMNIHSAWSVGHLILDVPLPVDLPKPLGRMTTIFVQGRTFTSVNAVILGDSSAPTATTTYLPIWYVMQAMKSIGQNTNWDGHQWTIGHLFA